MHYKLLGKVCSRAALLGLPLGALLALSAPGAGSVAAPDGHPVIGPGRERAALALIAPFRDEGPIVDGVLVAGLRLEQHRLVVILATTSEPRRVAEIRLEVLPAELRRRRGRDFAVRMPEGLRPPLRAAAEIMRTAIECNDHGGFFAVASGSSATPTDAARPRAPPDPRDRVPLELENPDYDLWDATSSRVALALWAIVAIALLALCYRAASGLVAGSGRLGRTAIGGLLAVVLGIGLADRAGAQLLVLHANNHAYEDIVAGLGGPDSGPDTQRQVTGYGASWLVAQRLGTGLFGADHDALGAQSAWWGALAAVAAVAAAVAAGGSPWLGAWVGIEAAGLPVAALVGRSESSLVIGQFLVAICLLLAAGMAGAGVRGRAIGGAGLWAGLLLLATGHVVGPVLAGGAALLAWMLSVGAVRRPGNRAPRDPSLGWLALLIAPAAIGLATRLVSSGSEIGARLSASGSWLPLPGNPFAFSLWLMDGRCLALVALALVGLVGILWFEDERPRGLRWALATAGLAGLLGIGAAGLLVCASLSDALRYQSTLFGPLVLLSAFAWRARPRRGAAARLGHGLAVAALAARLSLPLSQPAVQVDRDGNIDAQSRAYHLLRRRLEPVRGDLWLLDGGRTGERTAVLRVPEGRLSAAGPVLHRLRLESMRATCEEGLPLPGPVYALIDPGCAIGGQGGAPTPVCQELESLLSPADRAHPDIIPTAPLELRPKGLRGEFLDYGERRLPWRFGRARCPSREPGPGAGGLEARSPRSPTPR